MEKTSLWSLRLGFSSKEKNKINEQGIDKFLQSSFTANFENSTPEFLNDSPKTIEEFKEFRKIKKVAKQNDIKEIIKKELQINGELKLWWLNKFENAEYPLREKMVCFWHNHFVATYQKVKVNYWIFQHNQLLRENAFGNFKELTKKVLYTNAMIRYLDNQDNRNNKLNENLSRELLELFTLGIGNYTENDIKNGAKALAGLGLGNESAQYRRIFENNETITYLGKTGTFKANDLVDIIFDQPNIPYLITEKILKWFIYDNPPKELIQYYGMYLKKVNFEMQPFLTKLFTEEFNKNTAGSKIKNPLEFILQLKYELQPEIKNKRILAIFLKEQGMDLFNQPNVKGWSGGNDWLTAQLFMQRQNVADLLCAGKSIARKMQEQTMEENANKPKKTIINWQKGTNKEIIASLSNRLLFQVELNLQKEFETILKYDFDTNALNADQAVLRLFHAMIKTPEFQLI